MITELAHDPAQEMQMPSAAATADGGDVA